MKSIIKYFFLLACLLFLTNCQSNKKKNEIPSEVPLIKYEDYFKLIEKNDDVLYVVNFWATWCKPCVEELPEFMEVNEELSENPNFKMYLISMDMPKKVESLVISFLKKNHIATEVFLMDDNKRMNTWIPKIDKHWTGAIPATIIYKNGEKLFFKEGKVSKEELKNVITKNL